MKYFVLLKHQSVILCFHDLFLLALNFACPGSHNIQPGDSVYIFT